MLRRRTQPTATFCRFVLLRRHLTNPVTFDRLPRPDLPNEDLEDEETSPHP